MFKLPHPFEFLQSDDTDTMNPFTHGNIVDEEDDGSFVTQFWRCHANLKEVSHV